MTSRARRTGGPAQKSSPAQALYLYAISQLPKKVVPAIGIEGIDGTDGIEPIRCGRSLCWVSRVSKADFADELSANMENLEWLATASLRHQRAVAAISEKVDALPARFATVFASEDSLRKHVEKHRKQLAEAFERLADADEWGIKVFTPVTARPRQVGKPTSGSDYLKRKAELLQPAKGKLEADVQAFVSAMTKLAVASSPGGKASAGQPGLLWHGSFLVRRSNRAKLNALLKKFAQRWGDGRRIDCSGPWPPYSFVADIRSANHGG